jgi:hypothetical protein
MNMSYVVASLALLMGLLGIFKPDFYYKSSELNDQQIARNKRLWQKAGMFFTIGAVAIIVLAALDGQK